MHEFVAPRVSLPPRAEGAYVGDLLGRRAEEAEARAVIIGYPSDEGVRRAGGRVGTSGGPQAIRSQLYRLTPDGRDPRLADLLERTRDLGDLVLSGDCEQDQELLGAVLARYLKEDVIAVILGGGQEASYGHFLGYVNRQRNVSILSWDSRPDVAPVRDGLGHSRSAFRQALMHSSQTCRHFSAAGLQPHLTLPEQLDFITNRGGRYLFQHRLDEAQIDRQYEDDSTTLVSFDLGAVDQSQAPGVAAPCCGGMGPGQWLRAARRAGAAAQVGSIDLVELNPQLDSSGRTTRLAALTLWHFLSGLAARGD